MEYIYFLNYFDEYILLSSRDWIQMFAFCTAWSDHPCDSSLLTSSWVTLTTSEIDSEGQGEKVSDGMKKTILHKWELRIGFLVLAGNQMKVIVWIYSYQYSFCTFWRACSLEQYLDYLTRKQWWTSGWWQGAWGMSVLYPWSHPVDQSAWHAAEGTVVCSCQRQKKCLPEWRPCACTPYSNSNEMWFAQ